MVLATLGFSWWLRGKEFPCQCWRPGVDPWSGKTAHVVEQLSFCPATTEPVLWSLEARTPEAWVPQIPSFSTRDAAATRSLCTKPEHGSRSAWRDPYSRHVNESRQLLFREVVFAILDPFCFHLNFRISLPISLKKNSPVGGLTNRHWIYTWVLGTTDILYKKRSSWPR